MFDPHAGAGKDRISLCMIVRDEAQNLERCLTSVKELVHEIIVVDTGSTDATKEIAARFGARIFDVVWTDNFSYARNIGLSYAVNEWILVLDADEVISPRDHRALKRVIMEGRYDGISFFQRNYFEDPAAENWCVNQTDYEEGKQFTGYSDVPVIRMFKNLPQIKFEGIVHELVDDCLEGRAVHYSDIPIHHYRQDFKGEKTIAKQQKYLTLLMKSYELNPHEVKTCYLLGRQYFDMEKYPEAVAFLEEAVKLGTNSEMVHVCLALAYFHCQMYSEAVTVLERLVEFNPRYTEGIATLGLCYYQVGIVDKAIKALTEAINLRPTAVAYRFNLAALYYREHQLDATEEQVKALVRICPKFPRAYYLLYHVFERQGRIAEASEVVKILQHMDHHFFEIVSQRFSQLQGLTAQ